MNLLDQHHTLAQEQLAKITRVFIWILSRLNKSTPFGAETMNGYYFDFVRSLTLFGVEWFGFLLDAVWRYNYGAQRVYSITFGAWTSLLLILFRIFSKNTYWTKPELNSFNKPIYPIHQSSQNSSKSLVYYQETNWIWFVLLFEQFKDDVEIILLCFLRWVCLDVDISYLYEYSPMVRTVKTHLIFFCFFSGWSNTYKTHNKRPKTLVNAWLTNEKVCGLYSVLFSRM